MADDDPLWMKMLLDRLGRLDANVVAVGTRVDQVSEKLAGTNVFLNALQDKIDSGDARTAQSLLSTRELLEARIGVMESGVKVLADRVAVVEHAEVARTETQEQQERLQRNLRWDRAITLTVGVLAAVIAVIAVIVSLLR